MWMRWDGSVLQSRVGVLEVGGIYINGMNSFARAYLSSVSAIAVLGLPLELGRDGDFSV